MKRAEAHEGFRTAITDDLLGFLACVDTAYLATDSADGQPYAQHWEGPKGFIRVLDEHTIGFADFAGNRRYISTENVAENSESFLFLMDYANRRRIKIGGRARIVEGHAADVSDAITGLKESIAALDIENMRLRQKISVH